jgi:hypothetical protein
MMAFIKKYYKLITICLGILIIGYLSNKIFSLQAEAIGEKIKNIIVEAEKAKTEKIKAKYVALYAKADSDIANKNGSIGALGATIYNKNRQLSDARKEIAMLKNCPDKLVATNVLLDNCQGLVDWSNNEYKIKVAGLSMAYEYKLSLKDGEISEISALHGELIVKYGDLVKKYTIVSLKSLQRLNLGFFAGYSVGNNFAAGIGLTFNIIRLPIKLW